MILTICLWTKGRERYIDEILDSIDESIENESVQYFLFDNGSELNVSSKLKKWHQERDGKGFLVRVETNDPRPSTFWSELRKRGIDWAVFPSDDDIFCSEILIKWKSAVEKNPNLAGFGCSAITIDENGNQINRVLAPTILGIDSRIKQVAASFHQPPFVWPCLFLRISKIPHELPSSRFAFDWYISMHLLISGEVFSTSDVGLKYRIHRNQESFQAPLRRKFLEAEICQRQFVESIEFKGWVTQLSEDEKLDLFRTLLSDPPIYGDPIFSDSILSLILSALMDSSSSLEVRNDLLSEYAKSRGALFKDGESLHLLEDSEVMGKKLLGNVAILPNVNHCSELNSAAEFLIGNRYAKKYEIHCDHSTALSKNSIKIDCRQFNSSTPGANADLIVLTITNFLENIGKIDFTLTPGERILVRLLRRYRNYLPNKWINQWKRQK